MSAAWLGRDRYKDLAPEEETQVPMADQRGVLRGVRTVSWDKLAKALQLTVTVLGDGAYHVTHAGDRVGYWHYDVVPDAALTYVDYLWTDERGTWVDDPDFQTAGYDVHLTDPQVERCFCEDFLFRCGEQATPCKHILAALIAAEHPTILALVDELQRRQALAAAMGKQTKKRTRAIINGLQSPTTETAA